MVSDGRTVEPKDGLTFYLKTLDLFLIIPKPCSSVKIWICEIWYNYNTFLSHSC